jgi:hypothetical protein
MPETLAPVLEFRRPATPDPDTPVVAAWFLRHGWTAVDALRWFSDADLCAAMAILEASVRP